MTENKSKEQNEEAVTKRPKLGIIAGGGDIPLLVVEACKSSCRECFVVALDGNVDSDLIITLKEKNISHEAIRIGKVGAIIASLKKAEVEEVVMIGGLRRPSLKELRPDLKAASLFAKIGIKGIGDDGLLKAVVKELENEGFSVVGVQSIISELLAPSGVLTKAKPDKTAKADIEYGFKIAKAIGELDIGQSVVVQQGIVLGVEAIEGTDRLIARAGDVKRDGVGGVLVKVKKPEQECRVDLPTIGASTVENAAKAGLRGIAVDAGNVLIVNLEAVIKKADELGLFIVGVN
ncbi:MAG: LpxI family protein [Alphaproteobacteria bacterium]|nr:LpxI family protein [Alphaproteobacteria bacterium]